MGNTTSNTHSMTMSTALDSGMMSVLGEKAAQPQPPPKYEKSGLVVSSHGLGRTKRGIDEGL